MFKDCKINQKCDLTKSKCRHTSNVTNSVLRHEIRPFSTLLVFMRPLSFWKSYVDKAPKKKFHCLLAFLSWCSVVLELPPEIKTVELIIGQNHFWRLDLAKIEIFNTYLASFLRKVKLFRETFWTFFLIRSTVVVGRLFGAKSHIPRGNL